MVSGIVLEIDADNRLAKVEWGNGHKGWWYLKDLVVTGIAFMLQNREERKLKLAQEEALQLILDGVESSV